MLSDVTSMVASNVLGGKRLGRDATITRKLLVSFMCECRLIQ